MVSKNYQILALNFFIFLAKQLVICIRLALQDGAIGMWGKQFSGYVVTLLVIFYLQIVGHLPSVLSLQSEPGLQIEKCGGSFFREKYMHNRLSNRLLRWNGINYFFSKKTSFLNRKHGSIQKSGKVEDL